MNPLSLLPCLPVSSDSSDGCEDRRRVPSYGISHRAGSASRGQRPRGSSRREGEAPWSVSGAPASASLQHALAQAELVAPTASTVLLLGETGVGKELFAEAVRECSPTRPASNGQGQLRRHSAGAHRERAVRARTWRLHRRPRTAIGRFEAADQSTLFLDEIGDLPVAVQVKLLRVLEQFVVERLGSDHSIKVDVRIIAATNRNLEKAVQDGTLRDNLYFRLNVFPIVVPPLRERVSDIPQLALGLPPALRANAGASGLRRLRRTPSNTSSRYAWPGNVRELRNIIERAVVTATGPHADRVAAASVPNTSGSIDDAAERPDRAHPVDPAEHALADSGRRRGGRPPGPQALYAGNPHGEAGISRPAAP